MTRLLVVLAMTAALFAGAAVASADPADAARRVVRVGLNTQDYGHFMSPWWRQARFKRVRYIAPWNVALSRRERGYLRRYLRAARRQRIEVFVNFSKTLRSRCPSRSRRRCPLPSVRSFRRAFRAFRRHFRRVRLIAPWNEANHRSQPTFRNPRRAAQYYRVVRRHCRRCKIVAADVIDERNLVRWTRAFRRHAGRSARLFGLHNYKDSNPRRGQLRGGTRRFMRVVGRRGRVWLTETGGIVRFILPNRRTLFRYDEQRAARALRTMFRLARRYRRKIDRIYIYDFQQSVRFNRFDSGLLRASGSPRPGYFMVRRHMRGRSGRLFRR